MIEEIISGCEVRDWRWLTLRLTIFRLNSWFLTRIKLIYIGSYALCNLIYIFLSIPSHVRGRIGQRAIGCTYICLFLLGFVFFCRLNDHEVCNTVSWHLTTVFQPGASAKKCNLALCYWATTTIMRLKGLFRLWLLCILTAIYWCWNFYLKYRWCPICSLLTDFN